MSGFFKKLFNRIIGKEEAPPPVAEPVALPAPEPKSQPVDVAEVVAPPKASRAKEKPAAKPVARPAAKASKAKPAPPAKPVAKPAVKAKPVSAPAPTPVKPAGKATGKPVVKTEKPKPISPEAKPKVSAPVEKPPPPARVLKPVVEVVVQPPIVETVPSPTPVTVPAPQPEPETRGWLSRLRSGLSKSSKTITGSITAIFTKRKLDAATLQELEDTLIQADLGIAVAERIIKAVATGRYDKEVDPEEVKQILATEVANVLKPVEVPFNFGAEKPFVILVVGVNGSGKTTTIGKLGSIAVQEGFKVKFAACDTFRAAAIEQLTVWGKRIGAETISRPQGADAAGLAFDAMKQASEDGTDIVFIDTAGRLQNKTYLMDELDKVVRVIKKYDAAAPHAVLLVLDATTGQNALAQAEAFTKVAGVTGLIMTKLDGTARGGILVAIAEKFKLPIHAIGVGESIDDLQPFDAEAFSRAIAGLE